jgi:hypothetical protein
LGAAIAPCGQASGAGWQFCSDRQALYCRNLTTAVLLFSQFSILGLRELLLLASGCLFCVDCWPHAAYPGAFTEACGSEFRLPLAFYTFGISAFCGRPWLCLSVKYKFKKLFILNSGGRPSTSTGIVVALALTWSALRRKKNIGHDCLPMTSTYTLD